jgi:hypothetical protein
MKTKPHYTLYIDRKTSHQILINSTQGVAAKNEDGFSERFEFKLFYYYINCNVNKKIGYQNWGRYYKTMFYSFTNSISPILDRL